MFYPHSADYVYNMASVVTQSVHGVEQIVAHYIPWIGACDFAYIGSCLLFTNVLGLHVALSDLSCYSQVYSIVRGLLHYDDFWGCDVFVQEIITAMMVQKFPAQI